jgi:GAF domain-containing protein
VAEDKNQIIEDVHSLDNYLACSLETKAEAVVLIRSNGQVVGQIDIDSHTRGRFGPAEVSMLEELAALLGERWAEP